MSFKVGDRVRCVRPDGYGILVKNQIYIVTDSTVGSKGELIMLKGICSPGGTALYFANRFELVESEEIRVGDVFVNKHLGVVKVYDISTPNIGIRVQLENGTLIYVSPELLKGETPTDHRDRVPSVGKNLFEPKQHICMPRNAGRNLAMKEMVGILPVGGCDTLDALMYWQSAYNRSLIARISPTVTKIIHNGTTTITFFSDGKKVITRPSPDDLEKYDPFVGWCVGVVEHLYGGKEKAKKFYKKHAVVQKETK